MGETERRSGGERRSMLALCSEPRTYRGEGREAGRKRREGGRKAWKQGGREEERKGGRDEGRKE